MHARTYHLGQAEVPLPLMLVELVYRRCQCSSSGHQICRAASRLHPVGLLDGLAAVDALTIRRVLGVDWNDTALAMVADVAGGYPTSCSGGSTTDSTTPGTVEIDATPLGRTYLYYWDYNSADQR